MARNVIGPCSSLTITLLLSHKSMKIGLKTKKAKKKFQPDSNILASQKTGRGNCLPYVLAPLSLSCKSGG